MPTTVLNEEGPSQSSMDPHKQTDTDAHGDNEKHQHVGSLGVSSKHHNQHPPLEALDSQVRSHPCCMHPNPAQPEVGGRANVRQNRTFQCIGNRI